MSRVRFYLGTHMPNWLRSAGVPLFVSRQRLAPRYKGPLPRAISSWSLDSGGFTELQKHGRWTINEADYVAEVRRYRDEIGQLDWAASQDWMCEPAVIKGGVWNHVRFAGTGLSVEAHQRLTVENYVTLRMLAPELPFIPVLQGWNLPDDYLRHVDQYGRAGVDLWSLPNVGLGSVCRRQNTHDVEQLIFRLWQNGLRSLHGFGFKIGGLARVHDLLLSADSLSWSQQARRAKRPMFNECTHRTCNSCLRWALAWRAELPTRFEMNLFSNGAAA